MHDKEHCDNWDCDDCKRILNAEWLEGYENAIKHVKQLNWIQRLFLPFFDL